MPDDKILIGQYQRGAFGHTSMTRGGMVKCAGAMLFKDGKLTALWDDSGHYNSAAYRAGNYELNTNRMLFALKTLQARGVDISETVMFLTKVDGPNKVINKIKATDFLLQQKK